MTQGLLRNYWILEIKTMRYISLLSGLMLASFGVALGTAQAADVAQPVAPWRTGVISGPDQKFSYCVSEVPFSSGYWLLMALNGGGELNLGLGQKGGQLEVGAEKVSTVSIDGRQSWQLKSKVTKPELMVMNGGQNEALIKALATGSVLEIDGQSFALKASGTAVATLRACVASKGQPVTARAAAPQAMPTAPTSAPLPTGQVVFDDSRPVRPSQPAPAPVASAVAAQSAQVLSAPAAPLPSDLRTAAPVPTDSTTARAVAVAPAKALPTALTSLLNKAGANGLQSAPLPSGAAYAWQTGTGLAGSVREQVVPTGTDLAQVVRSQLAAEAATCLGKFRSDASDKRATATTEVQSLTIVCGPTVTGFVFAMGTSASPTGSVLSVIRHEGPENGRVTALTKALARLLGS